MLILKSLNKVAKLEKGQSKLKRQLKKGQNQFEVQFAQIKKQLDEILKVVSSSKSKDASDQSLGDINADHEFSAHVEAAHTENITVLINIYCI